MFVKLKVYKIELNRESFAFGFGVDAERNAVQFAGDLRAMRDIDEEIEATGRPVSVTIEEWQVISYTPAEISPSAKAADRCAVHGCNRPRIRSSEFCTECYCKATPATTLDNVTAIRE